MQKYMEQVYLPQTPNPSWWPSMFTRRQPNPDLELDDEDKPEWTMTHSWYAVMGGYTYNLRSGGHIFLPDDRGRQKLALRDEAIRFIAQHEPSVIPRLTVNAIMDKSSAGAFMKVITLFQALWFSLQCVARMGEGLSISLLELTTFAHCIVGLVIGWLWLKKPLDISEGDELEIPDGVKEPHWLMAMLYTLSSFDGDLSDEDKMKKLHVGPAREQEADHSGPDDKSATTAISPSYPIYLEPLGNHPPLSFSDLQMDLPASPGRPGSSRPVTGRTRPASSRPATALRPPASPRSQASSNSPAQSLTELIQAAADNERRLRLRMQLAQKGWEHYYLNPPRPRTETLGPEGEQPTAVLEESSPVETQRRLKRTLRDTLVDRIANFPRRRHYLPGDTLHKEHTIRTHLGITLTGFLYGGLHLLAWDATFLSPAEAILWKIASLSIAASGLLVPVTHAEGVIGDVVRPWLEMNEEERDAEEAAHLAEKAAAMSPWRGGWRRWGWKLYKWCFLWMVEVIRVVKVLVMIVVGVVYLGLRIFIFLEALMNLGHLPSSAYQVVNWSQYVPHIS